jgi:hypothetical protein
VNGDVALGGEITDELVDFAFHVTSFIDFVLRMVWSGSLRSKFDFVAEPKGSGFPARKSKR